LLLISVASGQNCPPTHVEGLSEASAPSTLHGTLVFRDELRQWLGLRLEQAACGETDIQLIFSDSKAWRGAESFRGCTISATGKLFDSLTGDYSAETAMADPGTEVRPFLPSISHQAGSNFCANSKGLEEFLRRNHG
jgi:hypothetical protein